MNHLINLIWACLIAGIIATAWQTLAQRRIRSGKVQQSTSFSPIGLKMVITYIATQQPVLARQTFSDAKKSIETRKLSFLYPRQMAIWEAHHQYLSNVK